MTGQILKRLQWKAHIYSMLSHQAQAKLVQKRGNLKFVRQAREAKRKVNTIDFLVKTRRLPERDGLHNLLIAANKFCISLSNLVNELVFGTRAFTKTIKHWSIVGKISSYQAGNCCAILDLILEKLLVVNQLDQTPEMENNAREAIEFLNNLENEMSKKTTTVLTKGDINSLLIAHLLTLDNLLKFVVKKCQ